MKGDLELITVKPTIHIKFVEELYDVLVTSPRLDPNHLQKTTTKTPRNDCKRLETPRNAWKCRKTSGNGVPFLHFFLVPGKRVDLLSSLNRDEYLG